MCCGIYWPGVIILRFNDIDTIAEKLSSVNLFASFNLRQLSLIEKFFDLHLVMSYLNFRLPIKIMRFRLVYRFWVRMLTITSSANFLLKLPQWRTKSIACFNCWTEQLIKPQWKILKKWSEVVILAKKVQRLNSEKVVSSFGELSSPIQKVILHCHAAAYEKIKVIVINNSDAEH